MTKFFPALEHARQAREEYLLGSIETALATAQRGCSCHPREHDVPDMIEEFAGLLEALGVPDRDGTDFGIIVPISWNGRTTRTTVTLDFGRRLLAMTGHPSVSNGPVPDEIYLADLELPGNLRQELLRVLVTYKNVAQRPI